MIGREERELRMRRLALALWWVPGLAAAAGLEGHVGLVVDGKPLRAEEAAEVVVYFRPASPAPVQPPVRPRPPGRPPIRAPTTPTTRRSSDLPFRETHLAGHHPDRPAVYA